MIRVGICRNMSKEEFRGQGIHWLDKLIMVVIYQQIGFQIMLPL